MEQVKRFTFDVGWAFLSSVVTLVLGFVIGIIIARWLGAQDLGLYRMTLTIYGIATLAATFGIPAALTKFVAEYKENNEKLNQMMSCGFANAVILGLIISIAIFFLSPLLASVFDMPELESLLRILAFVFPFSSLGQSQIGLLNGLRKMNYFAALTATQSALMCILIVSAVLLGFGVEGVISGLVISAIGTCALGLLFSRRFVRLDLENLIQNTKQILSFGSKLFGGNAISQVVYWADIFLIGYFLAATQVGYYSIAIGLSR